MLRLLVTVAFTFLLVLFIMGNTHHVGLNVPMGRTVQMNLIFLLMLTFLSGVMSTVLFSLASRVRKRRRLKYEAQQGDDDTTEN